jgi:hypothetical protein
MLKKFTAPEIQHLFFVLIFLLLLSAVASTESQGGITVNFNELGKEEVVLYDRYRDKGLEITTRPSGAPDGDVVGSVIDGPCDGSRSIKTKLFSGPSFLLRFPDGVTSVSLDVGDIGPSDSDLIIVKAYSDESLTTLIGPAASLSVQGAPTGCVTLSVSVPPEIPDIKIMAVEITSQSYFLGSSFYPNSIFVDNVTFEPAL